MFEQSACLQLGAARARRGTLIICVLYVVGQCGLPVVGNTSLCLVHLAQRQCRQCGRRLPEHLFKNPTNGHICNACHNRRTRWVQSGRGISSVNHTFITDDIYVPDDTSDPFHYIESIKSSLADSLKNSLKIQGPIKWYPSSTVSFTKKVGEDTATIDGHFATPAKILLTEDDIDDQIEESNNILLERRCDFADNGSDYLIDNLDKLEILTCAYNPIGGSTFIPLPQFLANKKCIINIKNNDDYCFGYSILAQLYPSKNHKNKVCSYKKHLETLNWCGIDFPVKISSIPRFESQNPTISIGVQTLDESNRIVPLYASKYRGRLHHVIFFYLSEFTNADGTVITSMIRPK